jgi:hypothetical protein
MGKTRNVVERFYERFWRQRPGRRLRVLRARMHRGRIVWAARQLGAPRRCPCVEEGHAGLPHWNWSVDDEIYVTGRFKGTHTGDLYTPLSPVAASGKDLTCFC